MVPGVAKANVGPASPGRGEVYAVKRKRKNGPSQLRLEGACIADYPGAEPDGVLWTLRSGRMDGMGQRSPSIDGE